MTNEKEPRGSDVLRAAGQEAWTLKGEKLARRVPRFAGFVEAPDGGDGPLTETQREFLDKFSAGLAETLSDEADEGSGRGSKEGGTA